MLTSLLSLVSLLVSQPDSSRLVLSQPASEVACVNANFTNNVTVLSGMTDADGVSVGTTALQGAGWSIYTSSQTWECNANYIAFISTSGLPVVQTDAAGVTDTVALAFTVLVQLYEKSVPNSDQAHWFWMEKWDYFGTWTGYTITQAGGRERLTYAINKYVGYLVNHMNGRDDLNQ